jgi:hypothetical protein
LSSFSSAEVLPSFSLYSLLKLSKNYRLKRIFMSLYCNFTNVKRSNRPVSCFPRKRKRKEIILRHWLDTRQKTKVHRIPRTKRPRNSIEFYLIVPYLSKLSIKSNKIKKIFFQFFRTERRVRFEMIKNRTKYGKTVQVDRYDTGSTAG